MTTALYRISSNEVLKVSPKDQQFDSRDTVVFGQLDDPTTPDGTDVREQIDPEGPLRVLGFAKIAEPGGNNVRNATQPEIDGFATSEIDDDNQLDADQAVVLFEDHPQFRKKEKAFADIIKDELNILRARDDKLRDEIIAATNFSALKTALAVILDYPDQNPRTLSQLNTAIKNRISKDD